MRLTVLASATRHGITGEEIRAVVFYPVLRTRLTPRLPGAVPHLFIGKFDEDEPLIEVIADLADPGEWIVFHAMMLRRELVEQTRLGALLAEADRDFAPQRKERRGRA
ncbi:hypothetical protein [Nocardia asteroides]|uniref:hypothetical protein n=1 Tax=Nocardia asteroides TaxID=1824 RepID=UPI001E622527|nr:hypothetical protein [Nocardia asteroides]UGT64511.1 hypothetical protein LTT61_15020 [Nocardia asteroides]